MNKITTLTLLILATVWCGNAVGQLQGKNILYLRFERKVIKSSVLPADSIFSVYYRLKCPKPSRFHSFQVDMTFQKPLINFEPVGSDKAIFDNGAAANASYKTATYDGSTGNLTVLSISQKTFDTSNHVLFQYRALASNAISDSASVLISRVDAGKSPDSSVNSGIDTVIVEGTQGSPELGWGPVAVVIVDTTKPSPPKHFPIILESDSLSVRSDSSGNVAIRLIGGDSALVRSGTFQCLVDTGHIGIGSVTAGATSVITTTLTHDTLRVRYVSNVALAATSELFVIRLIGAHVTDTSCGLISQLTFVADTDARVSGITYRTGDVCVLGELKIDTSGVDLDAQDPHEMIAVRFRSGALIFDATNRSFAEAAAVELYDGIGRRIGVTTIANGTATLVAPPSGLYTVRIRMVRGGYDKSVNVLVVH